MPNAIRTVTVHELKKWKEEKQDFQLIDVREADEYEFCNIGGELLPMGQILGNLAKIDRKKNVVMMCRSGSRSGRVVAVLQAQHGFTNLFNLEGGILAWSEEIDPNIPQY